jgi:HlyD family secretion protein
MNESKSSRRPRIVVVLVILVLALAAGSAWYYFSRRTTVNQILTASGTVEATEINIGPEISGRVVQIMVDEGDVFNIGDPLFRLDGELIQAQRQQATAGLQAAQDSLTLAQTGVNAAEVALKAAKINADSAKANAQAQLLPAQKSLDDLNKNAEVAKTSANLAVAVAERAVRETQYLLDNFTIPSDQQDMTAMEAIEVMGKRLDEARKAFAPYKFSPSGETTRQDLKDALDNAQSAYDSAVRRLELETALEQAKARLAKAIQDYNEVKEGPKAEDVAILKAQIAAIELAPTQADIAIEQAQVALNQAKDRLEQAKTAITQSQAALDMIDIQLKKLVVNALTAGVVLNRGIEPGEVIQAGAPVMNVGQLDHLTITVYVPEDRYGEIKLGQQAQVVVDSFPGKVFSATVTKIADKAEFTPRNVQTVEGRKTTVFAVKLTIANPDQQLKPGMPADVTFLQ